MYLGVSKSFGALRVHCGTSKWSWLWLCIGSLFLATWLMFKFCLYIVIEPIKWIVSKIKRKKELSKEVEECKSDKKYA